ncbi:hypothetical protein COO60DRAFT_754231 [Scenedesmus sp. NREL 46B-D3]|nr:hypothetical protein COO60DRAFT_754231 [Scenedesmus sp. NREL 46B-D3]
MSSACSRLCWQLLASMALLCCCLQHACACTGPAGTAICICVCALMRFIAGMLAAAVGVSASEYLLCCLLAAYQVCDTTVPCYQLVLCLFRCSCLPECSASAALCAPVCSSWRGWRGPIICFLQLQLPSWHCGGPSLWQLCF